MRHHIQFQLQKPLIQGCLGSVAPPKKVVLLVMHRMDAQKASDSALDTSR